jgi:uncharacterized membrane protein YebE (DUF533 family)
MVDAERLLGNLLTGTLSQALGGRGSSILRNGVFGSRATVGLGLLGVAMAAFEQYRQTAAPTTPPGGISGATPPPPPLAAHMPPPPPPATHVMTRQTDAQLLIRTMIAAAQADGNIDDDERARITQATQGLSDAERTFLEAELAAPHTIDALAAASRPEIAADVYAAAVHAIVADGEAERAWLARLGDALQVDANARARIEHAIPRA